MRIFKKVWMFALAVLLIPGFSACDDFLDKEYDASLSEEKVFGNERLTRQFLTNIYTNLPDGIGIFGDFQFQSASRDAMTDNATTWWGLHWYNMVNNDSYTATNHPMLGFWNTNFSGIRKANQFLKNIDPNVIQNQPLAGDDNNLYDRYRAEAILLRAMFHFELVAYFGDAPILEDIVLDMDNQEQMNMVRQPAAEVLKWVAEQCDLVKDLLPFRYSSSGNWGRVSGATAYALKSRALLYRASNLHNPNGMTAWWQEAADAAKAFIDKNAQQSNPFALYNSYERMFYEAPYLNDEIILSRSIWNTNAIETQVLPPGFPGMNGKTNPSQNFVDAFEMANGRFIWEDESGYDPNNPYVDRDPRFYATVLYHGAMWGREDLGQRRAIDVHMNNANEKGIDYEGSNGGTLTGYYMRKFVNPNVDFENLGVFPHAWIIYRYAEILLNYAEALNEAQGPVSDVHWAINQVRARVDMPELPSGLSQEDMRKRIRNERRVELCFEDHRFFDLRRWRAYDGRTYESELAQYEVDGRFDNKLLVIGGVNVRRAGAITRYNRMVVSERGGRRVFNVPKNYLFPVPYNETIKSPNLGQNPGWSIEE
ncbi:RagB/SusD family nutrient uptake outer membrane protein [Natronoflexus pectinivorans]|nr:RagB/SusD family nutrient uptake outer membrane protein [Natronoflexus pectinivorans]